MRIFVQGIWKLQAIILNQIQFLTDLRQTYNPVDIYLFKVSNKSNRERCEICSKLTVEALMLLWSFYCWFWTYFIPFSSVSVANFERVKVSWEAYTWPWVIVLTSTWVKLKNHKTKMLQKLHCARPKKIKVPQKELSIARKVYKKLH